MSLKVFVSYSWDDEELRTALVKSLGQIDGVEPIVDRRFIGDGEHHVRHVHPRIIDELTDCDIMLVLLTPSSVKSPEVREELSLAYEWHIPFLIAKDQGVDVDPECLKKYPWFLKDYANAIDFDKKDRGRYAGDLIDKVTDRVRTVFKAKFERNDSDEVEDAPHAIVRSIYRKIREIAKALPQKIEETPPFRMKVILEVLEETRREVRNLAGDEYKQDLSLEKTFIVRAGPIFKSAKKVYATSIDHLSRFWLSKEQESNAQAYTKKQPEGTVRLFVFSNPKSAHSYRNVLSAHHQRYGKHGGAVLLCALEQYEQMLKEIVGEKIYGDRFVKRDFGILKFGDSYRGEEIYEATLSDTRLTLERKQGSEVRGGGYISKICDVFEFLASSKGEDLARKFRIKRWRDELADSKPAWKSALEYIFGIGSPTASAQQSHQTGDVYHLVFFTDDVDDHKLTHAITTQISQLTNLYKDDGSRKLVKELWFGTRTKESGIRKIKPPTDGRFRGEIFTDSVFNKLPYCLLMRFENTDDLEEYYENPLHSDSRKHIFKALGTSFEDFYQLLEATRGDDNRKLVYKALEALASRYMFRADYQEQNDLDLIMEIHPKPFALPVD